MRHTKSAPHESRGPGRGQAPNVGTRLNDRQLRFALLVAHGMPAQRAAALAGYSGSDGNRHCYRMLKEPHIAGFVRRAREAIQAARHQERQVREWHELAVAARVLIEALVTGALRGAGVDPRLLRVELDAAREAILRAEGAVPQTVLLGELGHIDRIRRMSDAELDAFLAASPDEQARILGVEQPAGLLPTPRVEPEDYVAHLEGLMS